MKYLVLLLAFFSAGVFAGTANNNYQACVNGNTPDVLNCARQYTIDCENEVSSFSGLTCQNIPNPRLISSACAVYMDEIGYMTMRDVVVDSTGVNVPTVLLKESGLLTFTVIEYIDSDGVKHILGQ